MATSAPQTNFIPPALIPSNYTVSSLLGAPRFVGPLLFAVSFVTLGFKQVLFPELFSGMIDPNDNGFFGMLHFTNDLLRELAIRAFGFLMLVSGVIICASLLMENEALSVAAGHCYDILKLLMIIYMLGVHNYWDVDVTPFHPDPHVRRELWLIANRRCVEEMVGFYKNVALIGCAVLAQAIQSRRQMEQHLEGALYQPKREGSFFKTALHCVIISVFGVFLAGSLWKSFQSSKSSILHGEL